MYWISTSFCLSSCSPLAVASMFPLSVGDEPLARLVRMRVNAARLQRWFPGVIPEEIAAHGRYAFGEKQCDTRQAVRIFWDNLLEVR